MRYWYCHLCKGVEQTKGEGARVTHVHGKFGLTMLKEVNEMTWRTLEHQLWVDNQLNHKANDDPDPAP